MSAFTDYIDLRAAVIEQIGNAEISDVFDRLTKLAETWLQRELRMGEQVTEATLTVSGGVATLPSDFVETIGLYDTQGCELNQQTLQAQQAYSAITDGSYTLQYYAAIPTLTTGATTTNWLLEKYPDVYLYAVAYEAARHLRDPEMVQAMASMREDAVVGARDSDHRARYSRARVRVAGPTP